MKNHGLFFNVHDYISKRYGGVHRMASFMREHDWDCEVLDWAYYFTLEELKQFAQSRITNNTKFVGFGFPFEIWSNTINEFISWIKKTWPKICIIWGSQIYPGFASVGYKDVDYYVVGYGEYALLSIMKVEFGNENRSSLKLDANWLLQKKIKLIDAIKTHPAYPLKSLSIKYEDRDFINAWEWLPIEFSRGCKFKCLFCNYPILGVKEDHTRSAEDLYNDLKENYDRFGVTNYTVADETVNDSIEKLRKYADQVERLNFTPWFSGFVRPDLLVSDPKQVDELMRLQFNGQFYGVETLNHKTGKIIRKGMDPEKILSKLLDVKDQFKKYNHGKYRGTISLILGLPYETRETLEKSLKWLETEWVGESYVTHSLRINKDEFADKLSDLDLNYAKYGYYDNGDFSEKFKSKYITSRISLREKWGNKLNWKNDNLSFEDVVEMENNFFFKNFENKTFGTSCWFLGDAMLATFDLDEALKLRSITLDMLLESANLMFTEYKIKKLNI